MTVPRQALPPRHERLQADYGHLDSSPVLTAMIREVFPGRIAAVSAFGTESAVLLHLIAKIDRNTPVIFLDTGKHFPETLRYRDLLIDRLGLTDVRSVQPDPDEIVAQDPIGQLWQLDPDRCCGLRKVQPLERALKGFDAWITGRKRFHGGQRRNLPTIESDAGRIKINPLAGWSAARVAQAFAESGLPPHPLAARGYCSIGCQPCTAVAGSDQDPRSGRWQGQAKTECGIHRATDGTSGAPARVLP